MNGRIRSSQRLLFFLALLFYLLFFSGTFYTSDEVLMALVTLNVVENQKFTFQETYGQTSTGYGIGQPLLGIPMYAFDRLADNVLHHHEKFDITLLNITNAAVAALLVVFLFNFVVLMTQHVAAANATAALFAITTLFLPYSKTFLSEVLSSLCFFASFHYLVCYIKGRDRGYLLLAACIFAYGVLTRSSAIFFLPLYLVFLVASLFADDRRFEREHLKMTVLFVLPSLGAIAINLCLNYFLRGSITVTAYEGSDFTTNIWLGAYGLLLSIGRGLFTYNPILLVTLCFFPFFYREHRREAVFVILFFVASLYLYGKFWTWHAGWTLGSRFLLPAIPFLFVPLAYAFTGRVKVPAAAKILIAAVALASFAIQVQNALVKPTEYNNEIWGFLTGENEFLFIPQASALFNNWSLIADGGIDLLWYRLLSGERVGLSVCIGAALCIAFVCLLMVWLKGLGVSGEAVRSAYRQVDLFARRNRLLVIGAAVLLLLYLSAFAGRGARGLHREAIGNTEAKQSILDHRLRLKAAYSSESRQWVWQGYIAAPITGSYTFYLKVNGEYEVNIGSTPLFENRKKIPQHLPRSNIDLKRGLYPIRIWYQTYPDSDGIFYVYWTLPGGGVYIQPIADEYLYPVLPGKLEKLSAAVSRYYWLPLLFGLIPLLLFHQVAKSQREEQEADSLRAASREPQGAASWPQDLP